MTEAGIVHELGRTILRWQAVLDERVDSSSLPATQAEYSLKMTAARSALGADKTRIKGLEDHAEWLAEAVGA